MRLVRPLLVVLLLPLLPLPAGASTGLGGTTVVTAARSGYVEVELTRDARLSSKLRDNPDVAVRGQGRLVGAWLEGIDTDGHLEVLRVPAFLGGRTRTTGTMPEKPDAIVLHKGRYRLTVLTDGHPLSVTLHLHGLAGRSSVRPVHALRSAQQPLPLRETVGDRFVTYGATGPLAGRVRAWVAASATTTSTQVDYWSVCERHDPGQEAPFAYSPACPGGTSGGYDMSIRDGRYGVFGAWVGGVDGTDPVGLGGSFGNDGGVRLGPTLGVWLQQP
jgi:hypothetical protein